MRFILLICLTCIFQKGHAQILVPVEVTNRASIEELKLTTIGQFGIERKARPTVPAHYHTGIDIQRPVAEYMEPIFIFPIAPGIIISKRDDGPYAQLIIEHDMGTQRFWTVYEHIGGIMAELDQPVHPNQPIARFYTRSELDQYGWQFDHFHFEVLKAKPYKITPTRNTPMRHYSSYTLVCHDHTELYQYFYDPLLFLKQNLSN